jgi:hypothetical protein
MHNKGQGAYAPTVRRDMSENERKTGITKVKMNKGCTEKWIKV